jgi:hypothetical protein
VTPGTVFFDEQFTFHDGETKPKLFVVLGSKDGVTIVSKTTSKQHSRGNTFGCQPEDRFHNFYLPRGCCHLNECTWVCLDEFYDLNINDLLQRHFQGTVRRICELPQEMTPDLLKCALESLDITAFQEEAVGASLS